jgi:hypothetical protein
MHALHCVLVVAAMTFSAGELRAQKSTAQECCLTLLLPYGARAVSLGQTLTARPGVDGLFFNPASLANYGKSEFVIHRAESSQSQNYAFSLVIDKGVAGTFGLTWVFVDLGSIEGADEFGNPTGEQPAHEQQIRGTFAITITRGLRGGITATLYNHLAGGRSAWTQMFDAGLQYRVPKVAGLELGASIVNAGLPLQVVNAAQSDPTPMRFRMGMAYELGHLLTKNKLVEAWVSTDMVSRLRTYGPGTASTDTVRIGSNLTPALNFGAEVAFDQVIFVRGGYASNGDNLAKGGGGFGIGVHFNRFTVGAAKSFKLTADESEGESEPWQITFGVAF